MALHEGLFEGGFFLGYSLVLSRFFSWLIYLVGGNGCVLNMACGGIWGGAGGMLAGMLARDLKWETPAGTAVQLGRLSRTASFYVNCSNGFRGTKSRGKCIYLGF